MVKIYILTKQNKFNETATGMVITNGEEILRYSIYHANATLNIAYLKSLLLALKSIVTSLDKIELEIISNRASSISAALKMKQDIADSVNHYLKQFKTHKINSGKVVDELESCQQFCEDAFLNKRTIQIP